MFIKVLTFRDLHFVKTHYWSRPHPRTITHRFTTPFPPVPYLSCPTTCPLGTPEPSTLLSSSSSGTRYPSQKLLTPLHLPLLHPSCLPSSPSFPPKKFFHFHLSTLTTTLVTLRTVTPTLTPIYRTTDFVKNQRRRRLPGVNRVTES